MEHIFRYSHLVLPLTNIVTIITEITFFFRTSWGVGVLNSAIFNSFQNRLQFATIFEGLRNFGGRGALNPQTPPREATAAQDGAYIQIR